MFVIAMVSGSGGMYFWTKFDTWLKDRHVNKKEDIQIFSNEVEAEQECLKCRHFHWELGAYVTGLPKCLE